MKKESAPSSAPPREQLPTQVDVKIHSLHTSGPVLASASVNLNGCFAIRGVKVPGYPEIRDNQALSVAGARAGLSGARSGLFMEQIRIVKEMRTAEKERGRTGVDIRPRWLCWENVPGAFSSGSPKGEDFRIVLEEILRIHDGGAIVPRPWPCSWPDAGEIVMERGFSLAWRCLDAQYWGVAQRRKRIFLVADFAGPFAPLLLFDMLGGGT